MPEFHVPEVFDELSSSQVLCTELVDGISLDKIPNANQELLNDVSSTSNELNWTIFSYLVRRPSRVFE